MKVLSFIPEILSEEKNEDDRPPKKAFPYIDDEKLYFHADFKGEDLSDEFLVDWIENNKKGPKSWSLLYIKAQPHKNLGPMRKQLEESLPHVSKEKIDYILKPYSDLIFQSDVAKSVVTNDYIHETFEFNINLFTRALRGECPIDFTTRVVIN